MLTAFLVSFGVIFVAELGDKSQLMALAFATRFETMPVLIGITAATGLVHAVSVIVGAALGAAIPTTPITIVAAVAFIAFGLWTLRGDRLTEEDEQRAARPARHTILTVGAVFFLAELGDKTMFTTIALATDNNWFGVWIGSTLGMVAVDALAILVGAAMARNLPPHIISRGAATLFFGFGAWLLYEGLQGAGTALIVGVVALTAVIVIVGVAVIRRQRAGEAKADTDAEANTDAESGTSAVGELAPAR